MKRILLVDDVSINLKCVSEILKDSYEITTAKSGRAALQLLRENVPDLILLDVEMPEMSGYDVLKTIKAEPALSDIPIIFLTEDQENDGEKQGVNLGVTEYIHKPFHPEEMQEKIERVLQMAERGADGSGIKKDLLTGLPDKVYLEEKIEQVKAAGEHGVFLLLDMESGMLF